jgi:hypothetical protein
MLVVGALLAALVFVVAVLLVYGGGPFWPSLIANFAASLLAFMLALAWESERERNRIARDASELDGQRKTEVRRRFESVRKELRANLVSVKSLEGNLATDSSHITLLHPQLLEGAWNANAPRLSELVADHELIGDLAIAYGRIEELRWRLRHRTQSRDPQLDRITETLVSELRIEIEDLTERVAAQIALPHVQPIDGLLRRRFYAALVGTTATIEPEAIRGGDPERNEPG